MADKDTCPVPTAKPTDTGQEVSELVLIAGTVKTVTLDLLPVACWSALISYSIPVYHDVLLSQRKKKHNNNNNKKQNQVDLFVSSAENRQAVYHRAPSPTCICLRATLNLLSVKNNKTPFHMDPSGKD